MIFPPTGTVKAAQLDGSERIGRVGQ